MSNARRSWLFELFAASVPTLWCPPLTHYTRDGALDRDRIAAHLSFIAPWVKGLLVPGTTGDAWELAPTETRELINIVLDNVQRLRLHLLLGALHPDAALARQVIEENLAMLRMRAGTGSTKAVLQQNRVAGFTACPPSGREVSQEQMEVELSNILNLGVPLALYQLPQVTQNEMGPELVADLARRFPNLILFKDTSGTDRVPSSGMDFDGVLLMRGMEGDYAHWLKVGGGIYDGFLLASANSFGAELHLLRECLEAGRREEAEVLSERLSRLIGDLMEIVGELTDGNKFSNAGKAADHFFAHGPQAAKVSPPRLHSGGCLPVETIRRTGEALTHHQFMPAKGYLE